MRKLFTIFFYSLCIITSADNNQIVLHDTKHQHDHLEYYPAADIPEAYYDDNTQEIIIVADGFASFYDVEIISQSTLLPVISTQIDSYGDSIDISPLPSDNYTMVITSSNNNVYEGQFSIN